ncbi:DUF1127 domain-containing protein [Polaromonas jejuensis]|uniref:DUF1127 domain-containing protein n=1 Tax=Polaromonas jejuensis TaxID=457502 RepID=A0ABW0Q3G8_9BURK|nr:DUF1127 domain-containing protein [Polaromonas jejuensis]
MLPKTIALVSSALQRLLARLPGRPMFPGRQQRGQDKRHEAELRQMSTRELNDLGIGRGEIPALLETPATWRGGRC